MYFDIMSLNCFEDANGTYNIYQSKYMPVAVYFSVKIHS